MSELVGREFSFEVEAALDLVWDALTTDAGLATWYAADAEVDRRVGGELKIDFGDGQHAMGTFDVFEAPNRLRLVYGGGAVGTEEWLLTHESGVTHVRLIHSLPVEEGATWDDVYGDITRGWSLFHATLTWALATTGRLGRRAEVRIGSIADGAWARVLGALGLDSTPVAGATFETPGGRSAEVLLSVPDLSLLLVVEGRSTVLVDVEGESLYTLAATYGDDSLLADVVAIADRLCAAAG